MGSIILKLYIIHIFAWLAVWLAMYFPGLDIMLAIMYLLITATEIRILRKHPKSISWGSFLTWQAPGIVFAIVSIIPWPWWGLKDYAFFLLQFWYTPVVPLLSLMHWIIAGYPLYYYLLLGMPLLFTLMFVNLIHKPKASPRSSRIRHI